MCGSSGCGKTTLMRLLKRELAPHGHMTGQLLYCGRPMADMSDRQAAQEIGMVMQQPESQIITDRVYQELAFGLEEHGNKAGGAAAAGGGNRQLLRNKHLV